MATPEPTPHARFLVPVGIGLATAIGIGGVIAAFLALLEFAVHAAALVGGALGPIGLGIAIRLTRPNNH
ncbi:hypothetical protein ACFQ61_02355 [Streptomyces sp. NPDC056500]|uniref:hypothetical protein n=1 Tax=Streptomyces sp. NPDC056500 TaxID=3345840 RepID=UPI00368E6E80